MINFGDDVLPLKNKLYRLALRLTQHTEEAEDIVQETLVKVWTRREELEHVESVDAYCLTICRRLALDRMARKDAENEWLDEQQCAAADAGPTPLGLLQRRDSREWVMRLFNRLPERQRAVIQLRDVEGMSYKEIAQVLNWSEEQVKVNLFRARQRIKQQFEKIDRYGL